VEEKNALFWVMVIKSFDHLLSYFNYLNALPTKIFKNMYLFRGYPRVIFWVDGVG